MPAARRTPHGGASPTACVDRRPFGANDASPKGPEQLLTPKSSVLWYSLLQPPSTATRNVTAVNDCLSLRRHRCRTLEHFAAGELDRCASALRHGARKTIASAPLCFEGGTGGACRCILRTCEQEAARHADMLWSTRRPRSTLRPDVARSTSSFGLLRLRGQSSSFATNRRDPFEDAAQKDGVGSRDTEVEVLDGVLDALPRDWKAVAGSQVQ